MKALQSFLPRLALRGALRGHRIARRIAELPKQPGSWFVAVGAGHLAGLASVQAQLDKPGIATRRLR